MVIKEGFRVEEIVEDIIEELSKLTYVPSGNDRYEAFIKTVEAAGGIVIVGAGERGKVLYDRLKYHQIQGLECFCDNSPQKYPDGLMGKDVISVEDAVRVFCRALFIITPKLHRMELIRQLVGAGLHIDQILLFEPENLGLTI